MTPDYEFVVSGQLDEQYHNGKEYYQLKGSRLWVPEHVEDQPNREALEYHNSQVFLG